MIENGQRLGRYQLLERIASGGMADVYRAKLVGVEGFEKELAIKKILPYWSANPEFINMLVDEAKVLLHLTHANIVQVYELNREGEIYYLAMEYVHGLDLRALSNRLAERGERLSLPLLYYIALQVCQGLRFAHEKKGRDQKPLGIVHRDISPQNILLSAEGEVKITDFGIAKAVGKSTETVTGTLKGKFAYMSPEQALGQKVDHRTDIFALGILLYELASGRRCFKGENDLDTLESVKRAEVRFPDEDTASVPLGLRSLILKALKRDREERYASIAELQADLKALEAALERPAGSQELKRFLQPLFPERMAEEAGEASRKTKILPAGKEAPPPPAASQQTVLQDRTLVSIPKATAPSKTNWAKRAILYGGSACIALVLLMFGYVWTGRNPSLPRAAAPLAPIEDPAPGARLPEAPAEAATTPEKTPTREPMKENPAPPAEIKPARFGSLIVAAKPWGRVFLPSVVSGAETPFNRGRIPAGDYQLKVSFPPENKVVSRAIRITGESTTRCQINFEGPAELTCR